MKNINNVVSKVRHTKRRKESSINTKAVQRKAQQTKARSLTYNLDKGIFEDNVPTRPTAGYDRAMEPAELIDDELLI